MFKIFELKSSKIELFVVILSNFRVFWVQKSYVQPTQTDKNLGVSGFCWNFCKKTPDLLEFGRIQVEFQDFLNFAHF